FVGAFHGEHPIFRIDAASRAVTRLLADGSARQIDVDGKAGRVVYVHSGPESPSDIFSSDLALKNPRKLSGHNDSWLGTRETGKFERISTKAADGLAVESFLIKPIGWQAGKTYPMLLVIHGGPNGMHGPHWVLDWEVFASQGYAVLLTNPRGSSGYGEAYQRGVDQQWGGKAYEDLMASVDNVLAKNSWIDRNRLGVTGLSYGGFMTNWIVGHTTRFKAAVTLSSISNFASVEGTRDGYYGHARDFGGDFFDHFDTYWKTSPLRYAKDVKTPTLILHGEADQRVPQEQAEQWFRALKHFGVESELVLFPRESHALKVEPKHTVEILNLTTDWFDRHLSK
ncbi:MAG: S9 family peptidase, partial [Bryobacteraceae bacterium]